MKGRALSLSLALTQAVALSARCGRMGSPLLLPRRVRHSLSLRCFSSALTESGEDASWSSWDYGSFPINRGNQSKRGKKSAVPLVVEEDESIAGDSLWPSLSEEQVATCIDVLRPLVSDERQEKLLQVLSARTDQVRVVFENPANANNAWAVLRTLDAFGVQFVDVIIDAASYDNPAQKLTMVAALGAQKWLTIAAHDSTTSCLSQLRAEGYLILTTDLHDKSWRLQDICWEDVAAASEAPRVQGRPKVAIVLGNEKTGISDEARQLADHSLHIAMQGFVESLNMSVAAAVLCAHLEAKSMLTGRLRDDVKQRILLTWMARSVRNSATILRARGMPVEGNQIYNRVGPFTTKP